jgi:hypothetical protein
MGLTMGALEVEGIDRAVEVLLTWKADESSCGYVIPDSYSKSPTGG